MGPRPRPTLAGSESRTRVIVDERQAVYRFNTPTSASPEVAWEFESEPGGTILHQRFAAPKTPKERAIMEQIASWMEEALRTSTIRLTEQLDEELARRDRDAVEEPAPPRARPDGPVAGLSAVS